MNISFVWCRLCSSNDENNNVVAPKRIKTGSIDDVNSIINDRIKNQNCEFNKLRKQLEVNLKSEDFLNILKNNNKQFEPKTAAEVSFS